jgi:predicted  nucleic acid-binding Zn-ribbon protein
MQADKVTEAFDLDMSIDSRDPRQYLEDRGESVHISATPGRETVNLDELQNHKNGDWPKT